MNWKVFAAIGAVVGVVWAAHHQYRRSAEDAALWAEATEPIVRFGD